MYGIPRGQDENTACSRNQSDRRFYRIPPAHAQRKNKLSYRTTLEEITKCTAYLSVNIRRCGCRRLQKRNKKEKISFVSKT